MKKRLGAANAKVIGIVVVILAVLGLVYAFSQGGGSSKSKGGVLGTLEVIGNEFSNTMEDFTPDLGIKQFGEKLQKDGAYSSNIKLVGDLQPAGNLELGLDIKSDPASKKMQFKFDIGALGAALNATVTAINNEVFLNIPTMYDKPIKINFETIGADLQSDTFKNLLGGNNSELVKYKDFKLNLFSDYTNPSKAKSEFEKTIGPELTALEKNAKVEKVDVDKEFADRLKSEGSTREDLKQVNIEVSSKDVKALLLKVVDFYENVQNSQISGISDEDIKGGFKEAREEIEKLEMPENITFKMVSSKDVPVLLSFPVAEDSVLNIAFAGNKNVTDKIVVYPTGKNSSDESITFEMKTGDKENTLSLAFAGEGEFTSSYNKDTKALTMSLSDDSSKIFALSGKYTDVKKGESYKFDIESLDLSAGSSPSLKFTGSFEMSAGKPDIASVSDSVEVLKLSQDELMKFAQDVSQNLQKNYGGLLAMMSLFS